MVLTLPVRGTCVHDPRVVTENPRLARLSSHAYFLSFLLLTMYFSAIQVRILSS